MTDLHSCLFMSWLIFYLSVCTGSKIIVETFKGESATLPCKYDSQYHGKCEICWMKGNIPSMGCGDEMIGSDGERVVRSMSNRYHLFGDIKHGDVSLTISDVQKQDSGKYGCRIHVPGWFNDKMHYVYLLVKDPPDPTTWKTASMPRSTTERKTTLFTSVMTEAPVSTTQETVAVTILSHITTESHSTHISRETDTTHGSSAGEESSTVALWPSYTTQDSVGHHGSSSLENVHISVVILPVLLILLAVIAVAVIMIWKQKRKIRSAETAQNSDNSVIYSNSSSTVGLYNREMAVDNVYHIETESEYEQWN